MAPEFCKVSVRLRGDGLKSESQANKKYFSLFSRLEASTGDFYLDKDEGGYVLRFNCHGTGHCIVLNLKEMGLLDETTIDGTCVSKDPSKSEPKPV
jgi:hypothetical protein